MNKFLFGAAVACFLPLLAAPAWAGFQEGADAYNKGDYQTAMSEWMPLAQGGDAQAQNAVGALYDNGLGVISDEAEAFKWYSMAANQNYPMAMRNLGTMYATGHGTPYSLGQAQLWLGRAAGAGDQIAARRLAALPPVASPSGEPVLTPLAPVGSPQAPAASANSGFGSNAGPSSLLAQAPQPAPAPATPATADTTAAPATPVGTLSFPPAQPAATSADATPAAPAVPAPAATPAAAPIATAAATPAPVQEASVPATPAPVQEASVPATATTASADAAPVSGGTVADGWHAFDVGDYKTALAIWEPLAQGGDGNLQVLVGSLYDYGQGVKQDKAEALKWYLLAAQQGSGRGQLAAGSLLVKDAKQRNLVEAYKWLTIANMTLRGQGGDVAANQAMGLRQQIARDMSKDDIAKAEGLAGSFHAG